MACAAIHMSDIPAVLTNIGISADRDRGTLSFNICRVNLQSRHAKRPGIDVDALISTLSVELGFSACGGLA